MARWEYYNPSPVGRNVGDCSIRALSKALGIDWETAYALASMNGFLMGDMPSSDSVIGATLRQHGFRRYAVPAECPDCYTVEDFADENPEGIYVVFTGGHVVTIEDGVAYDSWNSLQERPQFYWHK